MSFNDKPVGLEPVFVASVTRASTTATRFRYLQVIDCELNVQCKYNVYVCV